MGWKCFSCGAENSNTEASCTACGGTVAAPKSFYPHWVAGAAIFFVIFYLAGTLAGGVLVAAAVAPEKADILAAANALRPKEDPAMRDISKLTPQQVVAATAVAAHTAQANLSPVLRYLIAWTLPVLLFVLCGLLVGFISDGVTIVEAGAGAILGQLLGILAHLYIFATGLGWVTFAIGVVPGFGLAVLGAYLGEKIQMHKERAGGITA